MPCVVVRPARAADEPARAELIRLGMISHQKDAFIFFFFQELTLQGCILAGAVLFIFCGAAPAFCLLLVPAAALVAAAGVRLALLSAAERRTQRLRHELAGFVAEYRGPLLSGAPPASTTVTVLVCTGQSQVNQSERPTQAYTQVVGSASVEERWGPGNSGRLGSLAVEPQWQRRGIGRALVRACEGEATKLGLSSLDTSLSELQTAARGLLTVCGWSSLGWSGGGGAAARLQLVTLSKELPHA